MHVPRSDVPIRADADFSGESLIYDGAHIPLGSPKDVPLLFPTREESSFIVLLCGVSTSALRMGFHWESC